MRNWYIWLGLLLVVLLSLFMLWNCGDMGNAQVSWNDIQTGTMQDDVVSGMMTDGDGNIYVAGYTKGAISGTNAGGTDAFVIKYQAAGSEVWRQQFGTNLPDYVDAIALDSSGTPYIVGATYGSWFSSNAGSGDAFLAKLSPGTGEIVWGVQGGTDENDEYFCCTATEQGVYVAGQTGGAMYSPNTPASSGRDVVLAKYQTSGTLVWGKQFGDGGDDVGLSIALDSEGSVFMTGRVNNYFAPEQSPTEGDAFLAKYDATGDIIWGVQYGTELGDVGVDVRLDDDGSIYVSSNMYNETPPVADYVEIRKLNSTGGTVWSQQMSTTRTDEDSGWSGLDSIGQLSLDESGNVYAVGHTGGSLFCTNLGDFDAYVAKYNSSGDRLWGYQFGTSSKDALNCIARLSGGEILVAGDTDGGLIDTNSGGSDIFVKRITPAGEVEFSPAAGTYSGTQSVTLSTSTTGATIRYTTDGSEPTDESTEYSSAISVSATTTIKAKAWKDGYITSDTSAATYVIQ